MEKEASLRGVELRLMSAGMKKRVENTTLYNKKTLNMMWRVQWIFEDSGEEMTTNRMNEKHSPGEILKETS